MKAFRPLLAAILYATLPASFSQDHASYDGSWVAKVTTASGQYEAKVELSGEGGTWQALVSGGGEHPCVGRKARVAVIAATQTDLIFKIKQSEALQGCLDSSVKLKRVDDKSLSGTRGRQNVLLVRQ